MGYLSNMFSTAPTTQTLGTPNLGSAAPNPIQSFGQAVGGAVSGTMGSSAVPAYSSLPYAGSAGGGVAPVTPGSGPTPTSIAPGSATAPASSAAAPSAPTYGTASGPGILQQWFDERASGTDPGWEYETGRNATALDNEYAARGGYDSGAALQGQSDLMANEEAQREGQLDTLAGGASGENLGQISQMLGAESGLASGQAGLAGQYDLGAATDETNANNTGLSLSGQAAMIPYLARIQLMQSLMGAGGGILGSLLGS